MMKLVKVLGLTAMISVASAQVAMAGGSVSLFGAGVLPQSIDLGSTASIDGKFGFGGGLIGELMVSPRAGIELGGIYLARKVGVSFGGTELMEVSGKTIYVPVAVRFHPNRILSLQAGGFADASIESDGDVNYGLQGGLRISVPVSGSAALFAEGRYNYGLKDYAGFKHSDLVLAMVGLTFGGLGR